MVTIILCPRRCGTRPFVHEAPSLTVPPTTPCSASIGCSVVVCRVTFARHRLDNVLRETSASRCSENWQSSLCKWDFLGFKDCAVCCWAAGVGGEGEAHASHLTQFFLHSMFFSSPKKTFVTTTTCIYLLRCRREQDPHFASPWTRGVDF